MFEALNKTKEWILDILFPKFCLGCGREGLYICKDCEVFLSEVDPAVSLKLSFNKLVETKFQPTIISVWEYEGLMEKLIYKIKFDGCYHIVDELVAKAMEKINLNLPEDTVITYVPMWPKKERRRGFNQSEFIARKLASVHSAGVHRLLEKVRDNRSQVGLGPRERAENVKGAFRVTVTQGGILTNARFHLNGSLPRNVLLVDDIYTTGATMNECAKVLKKAGAKNVWGFTLARKMRL